MGTAGDMNNETQFLTQGDLALREAIAADDSRRRWRIRILSVTICLISGAVMGMAIWMRR